MSKITATDAENIAREFIGNRHPRIKTIRFTRTCARARSRRFKLRKIKRWWSRVGLDP